MEAATFVLSDGLALEEEKEVVREDEDDGDEEDGYDDGLGSSILDPHFPSTFPVPPASVIIFRYSALSLAFSETAAVLAFDGVALMELVEEEDDDDEGVIPFPS